MTLLSEWLCPKDVVQTEKRRHLANIEEPIQRGIIEVVPPLDRQPPLFLQWRSNLPRGATSPEEQPP